MIPFLDLKAQHHSLKEEIRKAVDRVLESGQFALGPEVEEFEAEFASYCGARHAVAVNSGTSALELAIAAARIRPGDEVVTTPFSFLATSAAIEAVGATPVFADIEPGSYNLDPAAVRAAITPRTKAILPVHLYGQPADMDSIVAVAREHGLTVIEDAAQAHGAEINGRRTGTLGDMACFSFYPTKNLGACGEGGMVVTDNADWACAVRQARNWGQEGKYCYVRKGSNCRMSALQGAILRVKLAYLDEWSRLRAERAALYHRLLEAADVVRPVELPGRTHAWHLYVIRAARRDWLRDTLASQDIGTEIHYPVPLHRIEPWMDGRYGPGDFPWAERAASEVLSLPLYPELPLEAVALVSEAIIQALPAHGA